MKQNGTKRKKKFRKDITSSKKARQRDMGGGRGGGGEKQVSSISWAAGSRPLFVTGQTEKTTNTNILSAMQQTVRPSQSDDLLAQTSDVLSTIS